MESWSISMVKAWRSEMPLCRIAPEAPWQCYTAHFGDHATSHHLPRHTIRNVPHERNDVLTPRAEAEQDDRIHTVSLPESCEQRHQLLAVLDQRG